MATIPDKQPRIFDNDSGKITVTFNGHELRGWTYRDDEERRTKMMAAYNYIDGWCDGREAAQWQLSSSP